MSWLKQSDVAAMHPVVLTALELPSADDRLLNELYGFVNRCATQSAAHDRDYIISVGTARAMAGMSRYRELIDAAVSCGYFVRVELPGEDGDAPVQAFKLVEEPDLFHMILKDEKEWERQRRRDTGDVALAGPVRDRDGDACRWCGRVVVWGNDRKSIRGGTLDHLNPGRAATVATLVVACRGCNSARRDDPAALEGPRPAPSHPLIGPATAVYLTEKWGHPTEATYQSVKDLAKEVREPEATVATGLGTEGASGLASAAATVHAPEAAEPNRPGASLGDGVARSAGVEANRPSESWRDGVATSPSSEANRPGHATGDGVATSLSAHDQEEGTEPPGDGSTRYQQVFRAGRSTGSGSIGTGRDGSGRAGQGRDVPGLAGTGGALSPQPRGKGKRRRRSRPGRGGRG